MFAFPFALSPFFFVLVVLEFTVVFVPLMIGEDGLKAIARGEGFLLCFGLGACFRV